jgi:hypothetical protein
MCVSSLIHDVFDYDDFKSLNTEMPYNIDTLQQYMNVKSERWVSIIKKLSIIQQLPPEILFKTINQQCLL